MNKNKERAYRQLGQQKKNKKSQLHRQDNEADEADEGSKKADMYVGGIFIQSSRRLSHVT